MFDFVQKVDGGAGVSGQQTAEEFNNYIDELKNAITRSGNTLDATGTDLVQLSQAIATGGRIVSLVNNDTAEIGDIVLPDNSTASLTVNLPAAPFTGSMVHFRQVFGQSFQDDPVTIGRNGNTINGASSDVTVNAKDAQFSFFYDGATWVMIFGSYIGVNPDAGPSLAGIPIAMGNYRYQASTSTLIERGEWGIASTSFVSNAIRVVLEHTASSADGLVAVGSAFGGGVLGVHLEANPVSTTEIDIFITDSTGVALTAFINMGWAIYDSNR